MANTSAVYARIDTNLKDNAESILSQLGISPSSAIQMLYSQIVLKKGMPFELKLPSSKPLAVGAMTISFAASSDFANNSSALSGFILANAL